MTEANKANELRPGWTLPRYRLVEEVGHGGMAVVYRAMDTTLEREVAVKVLHPHLADLAESRARLEREAHAVAKLRHENILEIFDYSGPDSPESFIVTEFIHGKTLKAFLTAHPLPFVEVAEMIVSEVARALEHAHHVGVIHRDVKPENVMVRDDGIIKLMDFGIAQIVDKERMTITGQLLGSPAYMAPEHVEGKPLDFRTDVFAVGILLYQLATGQLPFRGKNPHEVLKRIAECKYPAPEAVNPKIGGRLARMIVKALAKDPDARYPDVAPLRKELVEDLADAGVEDARAELRAFFRDPEGWARDFKPRLVSALAKRGKELEAEGRMAAALDLWGRALAVDPRSPELRALVDGAARRRRALRVAAVVGGAAIVLGAGGFGGYTLITRLRAHAAQATTPPLVEAKPIAVVPKPAPVEAKPKPIEPKPSEPKAIEPKPTLKMAMVKPRAVEPPPAVKPATRSFELKPMPQAVRVSVDNGPFVDYDPTRKYELTPVAHTIVVASDYCFPETLTIQPDETERRVRLKWKPASLTLDVQPPDADIVVEGMRTVFSSGQAIALRIDGESPRREVKVKVSARGHRSQTLAITVGAADPKREKVVLEPIAAAVAPSTSPTPTPAATPPKGPTE